MGRNVLSAPYQIVCHAQALLFVLIVLTTTTLTRLESATRAETIAITAQAIPGVITAILRPIWSMVYAICAVSL